MFDQWSEDDIPDQSGRVAVVTGANGGLGFETTLALARAGARVVIAARDPDKAAAARRRIADEVPGSPPEVVELDLSSLASVHDAASAVLESHPSIDLLVNNAGIMATPRSETTEGVELQFGTNHLGHFAFTARLLPALVATPGSRVVTVCSVARLIGRPVHVDRPLDGGRYDPWTAYGRSKLANLHFAVGLHDRLSEVGAPTASLAAHPGLTHTELQAKSAQGEGAGLQHRFWHATARSAGMTPARGALAQLRAATDPAAESGQLYGPRFASFGSPVRRPLGPWSTGRSAVDALWAVSERETGLVVDVGAAMRRSGQ